MLGKTGTPVGISSSEIAQLTDTSIFIPVS